MLRSEEAKAKKPWIAIAGAAAALSLVLAGCAASETEEVAETTAAAEEETVEVAAPAFTTVEEGKLTCASSGEYPPFSYFNTDNSLVGFDIEVCNAIAAELGLEANPQTGAFNTLIAGLQADRYDTIIGSMTATDDRREQVDFTENYYANSAVLFVSGDSTITGPDDLEGAVIGVALGTWFEDLAYSLEGVADVKTYQADINALEDVSNGRIDAAITVRLGGYYAANESGLSVKSVGEALAADTAAIAVSKTNPDLYAAISEALATILGDGSYAAVSNEYFGIDISK
jgi:polar amino acid transport system substrate-binding protein